MRRVCEEALLPAVETERLFGPLQVVGDLLPGEPPLIADLATRQLASLDFSGEGGRAHAKTPARSVSDTSGVDCARRSITGGGA